MTVESSKSDGSQIASGQEVPLAAWPEITREKLRAFADASLDQNKIHLDDEVARAVGLPGVIAHGMLIASFLAERALRFVFDEQGQKDFELHRFQTRFKAMNFPGDVLRLGGLVKSANLNEFTLELKALNARDEVTTTAQAVFVRRNT